ncbi:hypothetical protein GCM10009039_20810 [Halocalculus aciditolerans]|uniref:Uncharacterized protein n=1 Tax=Halocalculus aciditolerans TaxID=1383812 RepID=A0A830FCS4_9EURY|nr:hypothetical protein GCM10009039_20810 [Halocalculus aciditolerans]
MNASAHDAVRANRRHAKDSNSLIDCRTGSDGYLAVWRTGSDGCGVPRSRLGRTRPLTNAYAAFAAPSQIKSRAALRPQSASAVCGRAHKAERINHNEHPRANGSKSARTE